MYTYNCYYSPFNSPLIWILLSLIVILIRSHVWLFNHQFSICSFVISSDLGLSWFTDQSFCSSHFLQLRIHLGSMNLISYPFLNLKFNCLCFEFLHLLVERLTIVTEMTLHHQPFVLHLLQCLRMIQLMSDSCFWWFNWLQCWVFHLFFSWKSNCICHWGHRSVVWPLLVFFSIWTIPWVFNSNDCM